MLRLVSIINLLVCCQWRGEDSFNTIFKVQGYHLAFPCQFPKADRPLALGLLL